MVLFLIYCAICTDSYVETPSFQLLSSLIQLVLHVIRMTATAKEESTLCQDQILFGLLMAMTS